MKTHAQHPVSTSRTLSGSPKASRQISMNELLQRGPVAQRMVGFEFQTVGGVWNVKKKDGQNWVDPGHGDLIDTLDKIKVTADGTDLEFITEPVDERKNNEVSLLADNIKKSFGNFEKKLTTSSQYGKIGDYLINLNGERNAHPQATVGVKLENIIDLMDRITNIPITISPRRSTVPLPIFGHSTFSNQNTTSITDNTSNAGKQRQAVIASVRYTKNYDVTDVTDGTNVTNLNAKEQKQAQGLIALIEHFIKVNKDAETYTGDKKSTYHTNAKNKMPVMPRTSIIDMYKKMEPNAQQKVCEYLLNKDPDTYIMYQNTIPVLENGPNGPTYRFDRCDNSYTIEELLEDLRNSNQDKLLSKKYNSIGFTDTVESASNRTTDKSTDIGYDTPTERVEGGIFELRSLPNQIAPGQWGNVVTKVAQVIKEVNAIRTPTS